MNPRHTAIIAFLIGFVVLLQTGCGDDNEVNPSNTAPTASFTVDPASGTTATVFQCDASTSSDAEDAAAALQVRWDWEDDGTWDTQWSTSKTANHTYGTAGTKTIKLEVKDTGDLTDDTTRVVTVTVPTTAPTASFTVSPESGTTDTLFQCDASGSSDAEDPPSSLQARWDWEDDGTWDTSWSTTKTASHQYSASGTFTIRLEVKDTGELADDTTQVVTVSLPNTAPTASFAVTPALGTTETVFQFDASGSDDEEDPPSELQVRWDWEDDGTWDTEWSTTRTASHQYGTVGTKTIRLRVKDTEGLSDDTTRTVLLGVAPQVVSTSPGDGATDVSPYPIVEVWFSQSMDVASLDTLNLHIDGARSRAMFYDIVERKAILYPMALIEPAAQHEVHIGSGVRNDAGFTMGHDVVVHFTTGALDCDGVRDHFEPNDDIASAADVSTDGYYPGLTSCGSAERRDFYRISPTDTLRIQVTVEVASSDTQKVDWNINFLRADGQEYSTVGATLDSGTSFSYGYTFLPGTYWVEVGKSYDNSQVVIYHLRIEELEALPDDQYEDNDFLDQAAPISAGLYEGLRGLDGDADNYAITLATGQTLTVTATETTSTGTTRRIWIQNADGSYCTGHTDTVNPAVETWTAPASGTYIIHLRWWDDVIYDLNVQVEE